VAYNQAVMSRAHSFSQQILQNSAGQFAKIRGLLRPSVCK